MELNDLVCIDFDSLILIPSTEKAMHFIKGGCTKKHLQIPKDAPRITEPEPHKVLACH